MAISIEEARQAYKVLSELCNPEDLKEGSERAVPGSSSARDLLQQFDISTIVYHQFHTAGLSLEDEAAAEKVEFPIGTKLRAHIAIPSALSQAPETTAGWIPFVRWHGGGGTTGRPFTEKWLLQADYQFILQQDRHIICIEPEYPLMPESSGEGIREAVRIFWKWMNANLGSALESMRPGAKLDWSRLVIFGESFGAYLAVDFWLLLKHISTPPALQIRGLILRAPLSKIYNRKPGLYCGKGISRERAERDSKALREAKRQMTITPKRSGSTPPDWMYPAHILSVSHAWGDCWGAKSMFEVVESVSECPGVETMVYITHGTSDEHVPFEDSVELAALLKKKWPEMEVQLVPQMGKTHAWDYEEPLGDEYAQVLNTLCE